jgi:hypothetical protein
VIAQRCGHLPRRTLRQARPFRVRERSRSISSSLAFQWRAGAPRPVPQALGSQCWWHSCAGFCSDYHRSRRHPASARQKRSGLESVRDRFSRDKPKIALSLLRCPGVSG